MATQRPISTSDPERAGRARPAGPNRRPLILVLLVLSLLFVVSYTGRLGNLARIRAETAQKELQIEDAKRRQAALLDEQRYVDSTGYLDDVARGEMGMGQRDEAAVVVVRGKDAAENLAEAADASALELTADDSALVATTPIWQQWLALFVQQQG